MREPAIMLAHSPRPWAQELHFFLMDHGGATVRGYVMTAEDAKAERYDVLIVDDVTSFLSSRLISTLQRAGTKVVGIFDGEDSEGAGKQRLGELGVDEAVPQSITSAELVQVVHRVAGPALEAAPLMTDLLAEVADRQIDSESGAPTRPERGTIIVVAGATGGAGATEVAIALATEFRSLGAATVLVDADDQAPSVAQRLGLGLHPNIRTGVDAVQHGSGSLDHSLTRMPSLGIEVLCGLPNPRDWFELRPGEVGEVVRELSRTRGFVVVNVGSRVEDLPELGGPARFGVARSVLSLADEIVLVGTPSPVGATRVVDWLADTRSIVSGARLHVVINQHPGGTYTAGELESELTRTVSPASIRFAPYDKRVLKAAWEGEPVGRGPFVKTVAQLASALAAVPQVARS